MAIDTTPSTVATNALQAIPFASLIGAPLDACIKAQANAAKTSWEFIREVGLTIDPDTGEKKAVNVTFQYNNNGQMTTLVVPLLVIVPIPYLAIDTVDIDFLANISAASSSVSETSTDTDLGIDASAEAKFSVGPFSLSVKANANYSSKQHSKASQDSRYSVEYTMGVKVSGGQADMPAGLATILNILQGSITSVSPEDTLEISPASVNFDRVQSATVQATVRNTQGILQPGTRVQLEVLPSSGDNPFQPANIAQGMEEARVRQLVEAGVLNRVTRPYRRRYLRPLLKAAGSSGVLAEQAVLRTTTVALTNNDSPFAEGIADQQGTVIFRLTLQEDVFKGTDLLQGNLEITADVPVAGTEGETQSNIETQQIPYLIVPRGPDAINITASAGNLDFTAANEAKQITITATNTDGEVLSGETVLTRVTISNAGDLFANIKVNDNDSNSTTEAKGQTNESGQVKFTFTTAANITGKDVSGTIQFSTANSIPLNVLVTVKGPAQPTPVAALPSSGI